MKKNILYLILSMIIFQSCGLLESDPVANKSESFFPLSIGNSWVYRPANVDTNSFDVKWEVTAFKTFKNEKSYYEVLEYRDGWNDTNYYRWEGEKLIQLFFESITTNEFVESTYADFSKADNEFKYFAGYSFDRNEKEYYNVKVTEFSDRNVKFYYDQPDWFDEEFTLKFEKGKGIVEIHSVAWNITTVQVSADIK